jgi:glycosyltransferase involved in cell wall biosynthesis
MKIAILATDSREFLKDYGNPQPYFGTAVQALLQGMPSLAEHEIHVVSCLKQPVAFPPKLAPNVFYHGIHLTSQRWVRTLYSACVRATRRKLREIQPEVVHGQGTERDCALSAVLSGFPNLITLHGYMRGIARTIRAPLFSFLTVQSMLESWILPRTGGVICLSNYARRMVEGRAARTWVLPNAVNESFFDAQREPQAERDILCIGVISPLKNQNSLIRALDPIAARQQFRLVFLGVGEPGNPYFEEFKTLVAERAWCAYEGFKKPDEVKNYLRRGWLLVTVSREENCPMVILEAMAVGLPIAGSRVGGIPDLIEEGVTGLMFDPDNLDSIRNTLLKLLEQPAYAAQLAAAGSQRARERHHPTAIARQHFEIYRELKSGTTTRQPDATFKN